MLIQTNYSPGKCWAVIKSTDDRVGVRICSSPADYYELDSKTSNVSHGPTIKCWLCVKHKGNASKSYLVTKVAAP